MQTYNAETEPYTGFAPSADGIDSTLSPFWHFFSRYFAILQILKKCHLHWAPLLLNQLSARGGYNCGWEARKGVEEGAMCWVGCELRSKPDWLTSVVVIVRRTLNWIISERLKEQFSLAVVLRRRMVTAAQTNSVPFLLQPRHRNHALISFVFCSLLSAILSKR